MTGYAELQVTSNYSFLRGASHIEELFAQASLLDLPAIGITDRNTLAGMARAHQLMDTAPTDKARQLYDIKRDVTQVSFNELLRDIYSRYPEYATKSVFGA